MWTTRCGVLGTLLNAKCSKGSTTIKSCDKQSDHCPLSTVSACLQLGAERARLVGAENAYLAREEVKLLHGKLDRPLVRMALDVSIEHGRVERALELIGFKLRHVDAVGGEAAERLEERGRNVAHAEHESGDDGAVLGLGVVRFRREHYEARCVVLGIHDAGLADFQSVDLGRERRGNHGARAVLRVAQVPCSTRRVGLGHRGELQHADRAAALAERHGVAVHGLEIAEPDPWQSEQLMADALKMFADDKQSRLRQKMMDVG